MWSIKNILGIIAGIVFLGVLVMGCIALYQTILGYKAISRPPVTCPACGKHVQLSGKKATCYKCGTSLIRNSKGEWQVQR